MLENSKTKSKEKKIAQKFENRKQRKNNLPYLISNSVQPLHRHTPPTYHNDENEFVKQTKTLIFSFPPATKKRENKERRKEKG